MNVSYFSDTDTLYIEFCAKHVSETRDFDEGTILDLDSNGRVVAITLEHASERTDIKQVTLSGIAT